ncbi:unnamed protein product [Paramecium pentaurelia]|uniref:Uncharacterized protein n=1 Tax=Paramecium pentaurelia TaxID=43138 RepID=A0A8S1V2A7_9CILI|nr:unnamed protein product [Paramecium pentaurelia]
MNCTYHIRNSYSLICKVPHKGECQRKLCDECLNKHGVDLKHTIPIKIFREMAMKELKDSKLDETSKLNEKRMAFKYLLSQTKSMLKKIWEELQKFINQVYHMIEKENQSFLNLITKILIQLNPLKKIQKNQQTCWWNYHIKAFIEKSNLEIQQIQQLIKIQPNQKEETEVYIMKEELFEVLTYIEDIDESIHKKILQIQCFRYFWIPFEEKQFYESQFNKQENISFINYQINKITNVLKNIKDHQFNKDDYSSKTYEKERQDLIKQIVKNKRSIDFIKFQFFQQAQMQNLFNVDLIQVDLRNLSFENIRIKNTSLIGGNFVQCNLNGSEFDNVDFSGLNLNGTQMFNCKWKNIKIHKFNKLDGHNSSDCSIRLWDIKTGQSKAKLVGHTSQVMSVYFSPDGNILASGSYDKSIRLWDVIIGYQKAKLDVHTSPVYSVCFSPDGNTLASRTDDNSVRTWDVETGQEIQSSDQNYKDVLMKFKTPFLQHNAISERVSNYIATLLISQQAIFQAKGALILKGEFINQFQRHYQNNKEVAFWKIQSKSGFDYYQKNYKFIYNQFLLSLSVCSSTSFLKIYKNISIQSLIPFQLNIRLFYFSIFKSMISLAQGIFIEMSQNLSINIYRSLNLNDTTLNKQPKQRSVSLTKRLKESAKQLFKEHQRQINTMAFFQQSRIQRQQQDAKNLKNNVDPILFKQLTQTIKKQRKQVE